MGTSTEVCRALDGSLVTITTDRPTTQGFTSLAGAAVRSLRIHFLDLAAGSVTFAESLALSPDLSLGMHFDEEYSFQGGRLRIGTGQQVVGPDGVKYWERGPGGQLRPEAIRMAVWEGRSYSLQTQLYGRESADLIMALDKFRFVERPEGLTCVPVEPAKTFFVEGPSIVKDVAEIGILECVQLTGHTARDVPAYEGTRTLGGELFASEPGDPTSYYLLVGKTSKVSIFPHEGVKANVLAKALANLVVTWSVPTPLDTRSFPTRR